MSYYRRKATELREENADLRAQVAALRSERDALLTERGLLRQLVAGEAHWRAIEERLDRLTPTAPDG